MKEINQVITNVPADKLVVPEVTRNDNTFKLDLRTGEKKEAKGMKYFGINITKDNFATASVNIGIDILAPIVETAVNTKMQLFNEQALATVMGEGQANLEVWSKLDATTQYAKFTTELKRMVEAWSAREISLRTMTDRMSDLGRELSNPATTAERRQEILTKDMPEIAMAMATK